jgi:hypothetical protein
LVTDENERVSFTSKGNNVMSPYFIKVTCPTLGAKFCNISFLTRIAGQTDKRYSRQGRRKVQQAQQTEQAWGYSRQASSRIQQAGQVGGTAARTGVKYSRQERPEVQQARQA